MDDDLRALTRREAAGDPSALGPLRRALVRAGQEDPFAQLAAAVEAVRLKKQADAARGELPAWVRHGLNLIRRAPRWR